MQAQSIKIIDRRIQRVKEQLVALGPMRPGTLTRQYRQPREKRGAFWQLSYTHQMKSRTEYVRPTELTLIRQEIAAFRRYKQLTARWVELALRRSQTNLQQARASSNLASRPAPNRPKPAPKTNDPSSIPNRP
jgi:hypothetical protein